MCSFQFILLSKINPKILCFLTCSIFIPLIHISSLGLEPGGYCSFSATEHDGFSFFNYDLKAGVVCPFNDFVLGFL
jgi:hypothetical protein